MIIFIVPFKAKKDCISWESTCNMLNSTLQSICAQTQSSFKVICCITDQPILTFSHDSITFISMDNQDEKELNLDLRGRDKANKILKCFEYAKKFNPSYLMVVDADDFLSNKIVKYVMSKPLCDGFFISNGFVYEKDSQSFFMLKKSFHTHCGSALIINPKIATNLISFSEFSGWYDHQGKGLALNSLPFPAAIYNTMHGENLSASSSIKNRPIFDFADIAESSFTNDLKEEFGCEAKS